MYRTVCQILLDQIVHIFPLGCVSGRDFTVCMKTDYRSVTVTASDGYDGCIHVNILLYRALLE
jgi:hypothetical protein